MDVITLYYIEPLLTLVLGSIIGLLVINLLFKDKQINPLNKEISPVIDVYSSFKVTKSNFKYQILYTVLLLFLVYIPLDFLGYCIPGVLDFSINSFSNSVSVFLFIEPQYTSFIGFAIIMYICVAFKEELLFRAISISRGRRYIGNYSSVFLFSFSFAMSHFAYLLISDNLLRDLIPALTWGISAFIIGLAMGTFYIKKRYIIPLILAHAINNIISATTLWAH
jgi:membrane protease YdiL (CAAX protease family)